MLLIPSSDSVSSDSVSSDSSHLLRFISLCLFFPLLSSPHLLSPLLTYPPLTLPPLPHLASLASLQPESVLTSADLVRPSYRLFCCCSADSFHKPGFKVHAKILHHLFSTVNSGVIKAPLWDEAAKGPNAYPNNAVFVHEFVSELLSSSFPNLRPAQLQVHSMVACFSHLVTSLCSSSQPAS